jgi:hypothetical protein
MFPTLRHTCRHALLAGVIFLLLLAGIFALVFPSHSASSAFAAVLQAATATCKQAPSYDHCDAKDPEKQGCASSARTTAHALLVDHGRVVGRVERRYSATCKSWWGRLFDFRPAPRSELYVEVDGRDRSGKETGRGLESPPQFASTAYNILYGEMFFDAKSTYEAPRIVGIFMNMDEITNGLSATIPVTPAPAK